MNRSAHLEKLVSPDFESQIVASTPGALRLLLSRTKEVHELRAAYDAGEIGSSEIRSYVGSLLRKYASTTVFPHQIALAAIAVMLETRFTSFAHEYIRDLAKLNNERFWMAARVARMCRRRRSAWPRTNVKRFNLTEIAVEDAVFFDLSADSYVIRSRIETTHAKA